MRSPILHISPIRIKTRFYWGRSSEKMCIRDRCYDAKNMHAMALRQLEEANKELIEMNDTKKEILYMIGLLYEKQGKKGESLAAVSYTHLG